LSISFTFWLCWSLLSIMQQHCWSCNIAVVDVTALLTWCNSAVNPVTVQSLM
jgi:hypothetical protein